jgi:lipopolysaccharide transport system permease protein
MGTPVIRQETLRAEPARWLPSLERLWTYRELLWLLTLRELKAKHRQTVLGIGWALVQPVAMMLVFTALFSVFVRVPLEGIPYAAFAYSGLICWLFLSNSLSTGTSSLVTNMNLITKASFPREVIPLSVIMTTAFDLLIGLVLLAVLLLVYGVQPSITWLAVPVIVVVQLAFTIGLVLWSSAFNVLKRDLGSLLPLLLQIWMWLSPVVYPASVIPEGYKGLYMLNPVAMLLESFRSAIFLGAVPWSLLLPASVAAALLLVSGYVYFKSVELRFADVM